ncbi:MAG: carboxysome shell carbonic anhydrase [Granulosicoccaceae bacterium]
MLNARHKQTRTSPGTPAIAPLGRPGARTAQGNAKATPVGGAAASRASEIRSVAHPLTRVDENSHLYAYERTVKEAFDAIVPTLKRVSAMQHEADFETRAQQIAREQLGYELPATILADAWVDQLDMKQLFAWCVFETYCRFCDEVFSNDPLGSNNEQQFQEFLQECGFHTLDVSPCADGRLAHVIRYVLRLPYRAVRRKSYAGAMFDIKDSLDKWVETELLRFREGRPNTADMPTRYLKTVVYHLSSFDPNNEGCAAHGSDTSRAARAGLERLQAFRQAIENTHCCGASIDHLLIGLDTDTDAIRVHVPDIHGHIDLDHYLDGNEIYDATRTMVAKHAEEWIADYVLGANTEMADGMVRFVTHLLINNISQIDYVRNYYGAHYSDIGHAERFIGAGIGFEEVQLRNLTYFAYLNTVEEAAQDLDVGIKIFTRLNIAHGLPVPVVVRYDYHGNVPGARERAEQHCRRVADALHSRYADLAAKGLLHSLLAVRDVNAAGQIEVLDCSVKAHAAQEAH